MTDWLRQDPRLAADGWAHGWSTEAGPGFGGDPTRPAHRDPVSRLVAAAGLTHGAWVRQVHGGTVLRADGPGCLGEADALWSDRPGLGVIGRGADCPLVLVGMGGSRPAWGFAHASWRSTVRGIGGSLLAAMTAEGGDPGQARAVICPSAGPCCYEVGQEVRDEALSRLGPAADAFFTARGERWLLDLWRANLAQLEAAGVPSAAVATVGVCTICGAGFPSHRRQGAAAGRFAAIIGRAGAA